MEWAAECRRPGHLPRPRQPAPPHPSPLLTEAFVNNLRQRLAMRVPDSASVVTDAELWVGPEVWAEYRKRLGELMLELHENSQPPRTAGTAPIAVTLMAFEMTPSQLPGTGPRTVD